MNITYSGKLGVASYIVPFSINFNSTLEYYSNLKQILKIKRVKDIPFVRIGRDNDGGYIMANSFAEKGGIAYSFGINDDVSWDLDMAERGYDVFMYDMTINALPQDNPKFHFFKEGISGTKIPEKHLDTLANFVNRNGHSNNTNMILKMDVEGAEWQFLSTVPQNLLKQFDQIVFEFHNLIQPKSLIDSVMTLELIKQLNQTHTLIHLHGNNNGNFLKIEDVGCFPDVLELTYLSNEKYTFYDDENILLPIELDQINSKIFSEILLGYWNKFKS